MKRIFLIAAATLALPVGAIAAEQNYPTKPVVIVMPYAAGGPGDTLTRIFATTMTKSLGQQVIIDNTAGAGGTIGSTKVARAKPDGYMLLMVHISHATSPYLYRKLPYDPVKSFDPVGLVAEVPMTIVGKKDLAAKDIKELVAYVKNSKGKATYGHAGVGSASHLCGLLLQSAMGAEFNTIAYKGTGPAMIELLGGQIDFMCDQTTNTVPNIKSDKIKAYAVASKAALPSLPNLPPVSQVLPGFEYSIYYGMYAPKGTPKPVIDKLASSLQAALKDSTVNARLAELATDPVPPEKAQPAALAAQLKSEMDKFGPIIKKAGVYAD
jgi:tripartite-type tricarboxylate transporter receptor subunit TctC